MIALPGTRPWPASALDALADALDARDDRRTPDEPFAFLAGVHGYALEAFALRAVRHLEGPSNPASWTAFLAGERMRFSADPVAAPSG